MNEEFKKWVRDAEHANGIVLTVPKNADADFIVRLGYAVMLDKPLIISIQPGQQIPNKLVMVADAIVDYDPTDPENAENLRESFHSIMRRRRPK